RQGLGNEEVCEACREFVENSCRNHNAYKKIYDSWIRSTIRSAKSKKFNGFSLEKFKEKTQTSGISL
ncbi:MAG: hypothetical protein QXF82_05290, partial [Nitrososphaeria archaeon]